MSKDIWHTTDITPEEDRVIVVKSKRTGEYLVGSEFEFILDNFTKWAYFDDLLALETELDRTRKALEIAKDALNEYEDRDSYDCNGDWCGCEHSTAHEALEQITALEQKDVK